jgi:hypothetical protein
MVKKWSSEGGGKKGWGLKFWDEVKRRRGSRARACEKYLSHIVPKNHELENFH